MSSIINKLALVGDDLYRCLTEGKEDAATKQTYKAAGILGKELTRQIENIEVSPDLNNTAKEMANVLTVLLDQIEAQKILSLFFKGEKTPKKKTDFLKKVRRQEKSSPEFGLLVKKLLTLKGLPQEEADNLIDKREEILQKAEEEKDSAFSQELTSTLQKVKDGQINIGEAVAKLKEILKKKK